jgi:hypothetical protein
MEVASINAKGYYCEELTAVPFRVLSRGLAQTLPIPIAYCLAAIFRMRGMVRWYLSPSYGMGQASAARIVAAEELSLRAWSKWAPFLEQLRDLEFKVIAHRLPDVIGAREQCILLLLHSSGTIVATLEWMRVPGVPGPQEEVVLEFNSYGDRDPDILTGCTNPAHLIYADMFKLSFVDSYFMSNQLPIRTLLQAHRQRVGSRVMYCMNCESAQAEHQCRANRRFDWLLNSGLLRQLSAREIEAVRKRKLDS